MTTQLFLLTAFYFFSFATLSYGAGSLVLRKYNISLLVVGLRLIIGMGVLAYISLFLALGGFFDKYSLLLIAIITFFISRHYYAELFKYLKRNAKVVPHYLTKKFALALTIIAIILSGALYLAAMAPPHATDELHYHFPQAREIVESKRANPNFDGHYFYGNIPKLGEIIFAIGLSVSDYSLAHALNLLVLLAFILVVIAVIRQLYGAAAAMFAAVLLFLFEDLTWNATVGFVDSMTSSYEVAAILLVAYSLRARVKMFAPAGVLLGLALSVKYSPLPTALYLTGVILIYNRREFFNFFRPAVLFGGFWYLKNLFFFGNPFYPLYFGHPGVAEAQYKDLMEAIWQWEDKSLTVFLSKLKRWLTYSGSTTYVSIWLAPLLVYFKRDRFVLILTLFYLLYLPYWFLLATHQTRFLLTGLVVASILTGILVAQIPRKIFIIAALALMVVSLWYRPYPERNLFEHYLWIKLHTVERQYALGNISEREYLTREFGCAFEVIKYLEDNKLEGDVIDNWSLYLAPSVSYFATFNRFIPSEKHENNSENGNKYYYVNESVRDRFLDNFDHYFESKKKNYINIDKELAKEDALIFRSGDCKLYRLY